MENNKIIDLHSHSVYSDGELTPIELLNLAKENNIGIYAITDHDVLGGIKDLRENHQEEINESGIKIINGIELTAKVDKGIMHILGYNIDIYNKELNDKLEELNTNSIYSIISYLYDLRINYNISFKQQDIDELFNKIGNIGRPHIAKLLIKYGYVNSVKEAFDKYLVDVYNRQRKNNKKISSKECIELIKNAGGFAILAHPYSLELSDEELLEKIKELISYGLDGIEVYHSNNSEENRKYYMQIVKDNNLLYSAGSDFHGIHVKPDIELGHGINNNLNIKDVSLIKKISKL